MFAARMHGYNQPLVLEEVETPRIRPEEVLVRVEGGMCRTDVQLIEGYFKESLALKFPAIPGHEIAGSIAQIGVVCHRPPT
jgi:alcohol dehydrogenase, propanol-preferring